MSNAFIIYVKRISVFKSIAVISKVSISFVVVSCGQGYKTFYGSVSKGVCPWQAFPIYSKAQEPTLEWST